MKKENALEKDFREYVETNYGGKTYKFEVVGETKVCDVFCVMPHGLTIYVEMKDRGEKARPGQKHLHKQFKIYGHEVLVIDRRERFHWFDEYYSKRLGDLNIVWDREQWKQIVIKRRNENRD